MYQKKMKDTADGRLEIRIPKDELVIWKDSAAALGITLSDYLRESVRKGKVNFIIREEIALPEIEKILADYGKIGSNINQIAHHLNEGMGWDEDLIRNLQNALVDLDQNHKKLMRTVVDFHGHS